MNYETRKESLLRKRCQSADQNGDGEERHWNSTKNNQSSTTCTDNDILRNPSNESLDMHRIKVRITITTKNIFRYHSLNKY